MSGNPRRILFPVIEDFSPDKLRALISGTIGIPNAEITLLHVVRVPMTVPLDEETFLGELAEWEGKLRKLAERLEGGGIRATVKVALSRSILTGIEECLQGHDMLLLVRGTFGGTLRKIIARISIEKLSEKYRTPIIVISRDLIS
ncbi:MAG: hypothetical protein LM591_05835 [Candidatus Korarchaeum sp.]|nr:hypothetical protein [Candidatus Korarchaeum sp.]